METASQMWTIVVIGISTVFICLLSLVAMVSIFKALFVRSPKIAATGPKATASAGAVASAPASVKTAASAIDGSIMAAIVAAISAASGIKASALRIRSIESSGHNTPVWGHVDRA